MKKIKMFFVYLQKYKKHMQIRINLLLELLLLEKI